MSKPACWLLALCLFVLSSRLAFGDPMHSIEVLHAFTSAGGIPAGTLAAAADGTLYGATQYDGLFDGSVYSLTPDGGGGFTFTQLHAFTGNDGLQPVGGLVLASDGFLYGTTLSGGGGFGTVFRMSVDGTLTTLHAFTGDDGTGPWAALVEGSDGFLYGTTRNGGPANKGTVFKVDSSGNFTMIHAFDGTDGAEPFCRLYGDDAGTVYGTTSLGGGHGHGEIFALATNGMLTIVHSFDAVVTDGYGPKAGLTLGSDGNLYGVTSFGGANDFGAVYRLTLPSTVELVHSLTEDEGAFPWADLADEGGGNFLGSSTQGGTNGLGTVFRVNVSGAFAKIHDFDGPSGSGPRGAFVVSGGNAYAQTWQGGKMGIGAVIRIDALDMESVIYDFLGDGAGPAGRLLEASDGKLVGTTESGSALRGTLFSWNPSSASLTQVANLHDLLGLTPVGGVAESPNGWFYGTTYQGGNLGFGTVFRVKTDGSQEETLHEFTNADGMQPTGSLLLASDGDVYGGTTSGGIGLGTFFKIHTPDSSFSVLTTFDIDAGILCGRPLETAPGVFYASAENASGFNGAVIQLDSKGNHSTLFGFAVPEDGAFPCGDLILGSDGALYGTTLFGGGLTSDNGTAFRVSLSGTLTNLIRLQGTNGYAAVGGVAQSTGGAFYGMAAAGGIDNQGSIYRVGPEGRASVLLLFDGLTGAVPQASLILASDGFLYGTAREGGWPDFGYGTLLRLSAESPAVTLDRSSGPADAEAAIVVTGSRFAPSATALVGGNPAAVKIVSDTAADVTVPILIPGTLNHVQIVNPDFSSSTVIDGWLADFVDVVQSDGFHPYVETLVRHQVAVGYGDGRFGRDDPMTRAQMAVVLLKAKHGAAYLPPRCNGIFTDVFCPDTYTDWIEQLSVEGITAGCDVDRYCPDDPVTRAQMAVFLLKGEHGSDFMPPPCVGHFADVACLPTPDFAVDWIEKLFNEGVTAGCDTNPARYCPGDPVIRGQMAVFAVRAFQLDPGGP